MTVAFDASAETAVAFTTTSPTNFDLVPVGTARGVVVVVTQADATDRVTGVTADGVAMSRILRATDATGGSDPAMSAYLYFLGASVPTGTLTIAVSHDGNSVEKHAVAASFTAAADTEIGDSGILEDDQADPQILLETAASSLRFAGIASGVGNIANLTEVTSSTRVLTHDYGTHTAVTSVEDAASTSFTIGWTAASDDVAMVAVAIQEVAAGDPEAGLIWGKLLRGGLLIGGGMLGR